jgi:hypothetical protein
LILKIQNASVFLVCCWILTVLVSILIFERSIVHYRPILQEYHHLNWRWKLYINQITAEGHYSGWTWKHEILFSIHLDAIYQ